MYVYKYRIYYKYTAIYIYTINNIYNIPWFLAVISWIWVFLTFKFLIHLEYILA